MGCALVVLCFCLMVAVPSNLSRVSVSCASDGSKRQVVDRAMPFARFPGDHSPLKRLRSLVSCPPPESHTFGGCARRPATSPNMNLNTADEQLCRRDASDGPRAVGRRRKQQPPPSLAAAIGLPDEGEKSGEHDADGAVEGRGQRACGACDESCDLIQHHGCPDKRWEVGGAHCRCLTKESACARQKYRNLAIWGL